MSQARRCRIIRCNVHQEIVNFFDVFAVFLFGAATQQTAVNIGKFSIGRLRPHFFAACHLNYTTFSCVDTVDLPRYVTEYVCTATEEYKTLDMRSVQNESTKNTSQRIVGEHVAVFVFSFKCTHLFQYWALHYKAYSIQFNVFIPEYYIHIK